MSNVLQATPIVLTAEERAELEGMARSTKSEHRARFKARIVLMAADGAATRAIGRALRGKATVATWSIFSRRHAASKFNADQEAVEMPEN
jgi:hypothetical protein